MSKKVFSEKISESMNRKISAIENMAFDDFFEKDYFFEVALCLSYMTLSKEKIIAKDMKNHDRMGRLSQMVDTVEVDRIFNPGFAEEMPKILFARENNNLWILDNIRDSIMHGMFDVDDERKCFLINNNQYDRELVAEIPFSWFIAYAKNDILSKKILDNYTVCGFYYNKYKKKLHKFDTKKELMNNILYRVNIRGNGFNVKDIENRIRELFDIYSKEDIDESEVEGYRSRIDCEKIKYNERYLVSFYIASEKVKECVEREFSGVSVDIFVDNRKYRFVNKTFKRLPSSYDDYDLMFNDFNNQVSSKGMSLLRYISNMIEYMDGEVRDSSLDMDGVNKFNMLLYGEKIKYKDVNLITEKNLKVLRSIGLNVYGLATLVINHESLYNESFFNLHPSDYGIMACIKSSYLEFAQRRKNILMNILDTEIALFSKREQYNNCNNDSIRAKLQLMIDGLISKRELYEKELCDLASSMNFERITKESDIDYKEKEKIDSVISDYFDHFYGASTISDKRRVKKVIGRLLDCKIEEEAKYTYGYCNNMKDVLVIIRNCFSHIGRVYIGKDRGMGTNVVLNDYDSDGKKSGEVICRYADLIKLLWEPYCDNSSLKIK